MDKQIERAERRLILLQAQRAQVEREIRTLKQQKETLLRSIEDNLAVLRRIRVLLQRSVDEIQVR